jgi:Ca2+/Na+ antiporter
VILALFLRIVYPSGERKHVWVLTGLNAVVNMTAAFSHLCFWIDENNHYHGGPLTNFCLIVSMVLLAELLYITLAKFRTKRKREIWLPLFVVLLVLTGVFMDSKTDKSVQPLDYLTSSVAISCVCYYIWMHLQFVREHEQALQAEQRIQIMMTQIKPHFLYNSLGTIEELCESNPQMAKATTVTFSRYLRGNMTSIESVGAIPFERELSHTKSYLELEQIRFEDALHVEYDISCTDFSIPALTLEPLVENAVRYGVRGNEDGRGAVMISTREFPDHFEVSVKDDGPGFDSQKIPDDGHPHIGLANVRERLLQVCNGTLKIESSAGFGTVVTIVLLKRRNGIEHE